MSYLDILVFMLWVGEWHAQFSHVSPSWKKIQRSNRKMLVEDIGSSCKDTEQKNMWKFHYHIDKMKAICCGERKGGWRANKWMRMEEGEWIIDRRVGKTCLSPCLWFWCQYKMRETQEDSVPTPFYLSFGFCLGASKTEQTGSHVCSMPNKTAHGSCNNPCLVIFNKDLDVIMPSLLFSCHTLWLILSLNL